MRVAPIVLGDTMKTTIYLVRHAEAAGNLSRTFQGHTDCPITTRGEAQLACLAERFRTVYCDAVYTSPLLRARQTAGAVNKYHGLPVQIADGLIEVNGGDFEGLQWDEIGRSFPAEMALWNETPYLFCAPHGDTMLAVYTRVAAAMEEIARANAGKTVAAVSHGCAIRNYLAFAQGLGIERLRDIMWEENTAVCRIEFDDVFRPTVLYRNDASHLPTELCTLAAQGWWKTTITEVQA